MRAVRERVVEDGAVRALKEPHVFLPVRSSARPLGIVSARADLVVDQMCCNVVLSFGSFVEFTVGV